MLWGFCLIKQQLQICFNGNVDELVPQSLTVTAVSLITFHYLSYLLQTSTLLYFNAHLSSLLVLPLVCFKIITLHFIINILGREQQTDICYQPLVNSWYCNVSLCVCLSTRYNKIAETAITKLASWIVSPLWVLANHLILGQKVKDQGYMVTKWRNILITIIWLFEWLSGRTSVSDQWTFTGLHQTCSWWVTIYMGKPSAVGQPTRPTQSFHPHGVN